jgi:signal peptidase I
MRPWIRGFFVPKITPAYVVRVLAVAAAAFIFFRFVCTPFVVRGKSMEPTYRDGSFDFIVKPRYLFSEPARGDVLALRMAGERVFLLKRVVAVAGDTVAFEQGRLIRNGQVVNEPYVQGPCNWELGPREVRAGHLYVVGDNRSMPLEGHDFGQVALWRVVGSPLW